MSVYNELATEQAGRKSVRGTPKNRVFSLSYPGADIQIGFPPGTPLPDSLPSKYSCS